MQVYMSSKNQLDSEGNNPYPKTDNSGVVLALNEATSAWLASVAGGAAPTKLDALLQ